MKAKVKDLARDAVFGRWLPGEYARAARAGLEPRKVLFVAQTARELPDSFTLVWERMRRVHGLDCRFISLERGSVPVARYLRNCAAMLHQAASARLVFLDDASETLSCVKLRPETHVVQLWHACGAFKKFGMSTAEKRFGGTRAEKERHPFYGNLSLVSVSSPEVCWAYREAMALEERPGVVRPLGVPRTDVYFDEGFRNASRELVHALLPQAGSRKLLLYAPTYRGEHPGATGPDALDVRALRERLGSEWFLVVKHHPFVKVAPPIPGDCADFGAFAPDGLPIDALLCAADALVTDYSSVVFEYSLLGHPMAFFAYDLNDYDDWRGFYYPYEEMTPGPVVHTTAELADYLADADARFDARRVAAFRDKFMDACDGHATARICEAALALADLRQNSEIS